MLLAVTDTARWAVEARGGHVVDRQDDGRALVRLAEVDPWRLVPWVLGFGADVEVVAPPALRREVRDRLVAVAGTA